MVRSKSNVGGPLQKVCEECESSPTNPGGTLERPHCVFFCFSNHERFNDNKKTYLEAGTCEETWCLRTSCLSK